MEVSTDSANNCVRCTLLNYIDHIFSFLFSFLGGHQGGVVSQNDLDKFDAKAAKERDDTAAAAAAETKKNKPTKKKKGKKGKRR